MSFAPENGCNAPCVFLTRRSELDDRWDPNFYKRMGEFRNRVQQCPFPIKPLRGFLSEVQYGISERATEEPIGVPMLRMINLQDDTWDLADLKYIALRAEDVKRYLLHSGDILFNRTNSKELVGKCGVFNLSGQYVFASYLIRVRLRQESLRPEYVTAFLSSGLGRIQIDAVSRQIAGMTNINAEEIRALSIPVLNEGAQAAVVSAWRVAIQRRDKTLEKAREILATLDDVLLDELSIPRQPEPPNTLSGRMFQRKLRGLTGSRWDPIANQNRRRCLEAAIQAANCPVVPLRRLIAVSKDLVTDVPDGEPYLGLENIDGTTGDYISTNEKESIGTAAKFSPEQILFPKLRPYLNKTYLAAFSGVCSTEFHVFSPIGISADYLTAFLRSRAIVGITSMLMTGNTLPRLQMNDIERLLVPVPSPITQKRICDRLNDIRSKARALRKQARADLEAAKREIEALILGKDLTV